MSFEAIRRAFVQALHEHERRAHLRLSDDSERFPFNAGDVEEPEQEGEQPEAVASACEYYNEACENSGSAEASEMLLAGERVFAVLVTTDGDDGWVELYTPQGTLVGAARTYLELVCWLDVAKARALAEDASFPPELADRMARATANRAQWDAERGPADNGADEESDETFLVNERHGFRVPVDDDWLPQLPPHAEWDEARVAVDDDAHISVRVEDAAPVAFPAFCEAERARLGGAGAFLVSCEEAKALLPECAFDVVFAVDRRVTRQVVLFARGKRVVFEQEGLDDLRPHARDFGFVIDGFEWLD